MNNLEASRWSPDLSRYQCQLESSRTIGQASLQSLSSAWWISCSNIFSWNCSTGGRPSSRFDFQPGEAILARGPFVDRKSEIQFRQEVCSAERSIRAGRFRRRLSDGPPLTNERARALGSARSCSSAETGRVRRGWMPRPSSSTTRNRNFPVAWVDGLGYGAARPYYPRKIFDSRRLEHARLQDLCSPTGISVRRVRWPPTHRMYYRILDACFGSGGS